MNLLIVSCGTRSKLVRFFKESDNGIHRVVATDVSPLAPALYEADAYYLVPGMKEKGYLERILEICRNEKIQGILPLFEDELTLMATNRTLFEEEGVTVIVSDDRTVELCRDKYDFSCYMDEKGIPVLPFFQGITAFEEAYKKARVDFPVFMKPTRGCGSIGIQKVEHMELLKVLCKYSGEEVLIQPFCTGQEYGADLYVDLITHEIVSIFLKKKLRMRAGETEKAVSVKDERVWKLLEKVVSVLNLAGPIDIDLFEVDGNFFVSEINPRFGGGYPHAYGCEVDFTKYIGKNMAGKENQPDIGNYESDVFMIKYSDEIIKK